MDRQIVSVVLCIVWFLAIVPSALFAPFAAFLFGDPTGTSVMATPFAVLWLIAPIVYLASGLVTIILLYKKKEGAAFVAAMIPVAYVSVQLLFGLLLFGFNL